MIYVKINLQTMPYGAICACPIVNRVLKKTVRDGNRSRKYWWITNPSNPCEGVLATKHAEILDSAHAQVLSEAGAREIRDQYLCTAPDGSGRSLEEYKAETETGQPWL